MKKRYIAGGIVAAAVVIGVATSGGGEGGDSKDTAKPATPVSAAADDKSGDKSNDKPRQSVAEGFRTYVEENGTVGEKAAIGHVTKVQGADRNNDILDSAEVYTDFTGDLMDSEATGSAKLIASAFADFQASRDKDSKNGLVTVYNASGSMLGNGKY